MFSFFLFLQLFVVYLRLNRSDVSYYEANTLNFYITYDNVSGADCRAENEKFNKGINCCHSTNGFVECTATNNEGKCFAPEFNNTGNYDLQMNFTYAQNICKKNGYRLCTMNEVMTLCDTSSCNLNERGIWTTNPCTPWYWQWKSGGNTGQCRSGLERSGAVKCVNGTFNDCVTKFNTQFFHVVYGYQIESNATYLEAVAICNEYGRRLPNLYNDSVKDGICHNLGLNKKWSWTTETCSYTLNPSTSPTPFPSHSPTIRSKSPTNEPSLMPTINPTLQPSNNPTNTPSKYPTSIPSFTPTLYPSNTPTYHPSSNPISITGKYTIDYSLTITSSNDINIESNVNSYYITEAVRISLANSIEVTDTIQNNYDTQNWRYLFTLRITNTNLRRLLSLETIDLLLETDSLDIKNEIKVKSSDSNETDIIESDIADILRLNFNDSTIEIELAVNNNKTSNNSRLILYGVALLAILLILGFFVILLYLFCKRSTKKKNLETNVNQLQSTKLESTVHTTSTANVDINYLTSNSSDNRIQIYTTPEIDDKVTEENREESPPKNENKGPMLGATTFGLGRKNTEEKEEESESKSEEQMDESNEELYIEDNIPPTKDTTKDSPLTPIGDIELQSIQDQDDNNDSDNSEQKAIDNSESEAPEQLFFTNEGDLQLDYSNVIEWTTSDVCKWLSSVLNTNEYSSIIQNNSINGKNLIYLTSNDLVEMGITKIGHKRSILVGIQKLRISINYE